MRDFNRSKKIHERAVQSSRQYLKAERTFLADLIEVERDRTFELFDITYLTPYCVKVLGLGEEISKCLVRIVNKSVEVPELAESVIKGEVDVYKAKTIASSITKENKDDWLKKAKTMSKAKLEKEVREQQGLRKRLTLDLKERTFDRLERARDIVSSKVASFASYEDTIDEALQEFLYRHDPVEKAERSRDHSLERQVTERDREQCQWIYKDGTQCDQRKWLHRHHIIHKSKGGPDTLENLITLCSAHHRIMHTQH